MLYQPVSVTGYVYELRFDVDLGGLSSASRDGQLDTGQVALPGNRWRGPDPGQGGGRSDLDRSRFKRTADGRTNAQVVPNAALGAGWYSAVVEVISDFEAIAPAG